MCSVSVMRRSMMIFSALGIGILVFFVMSVSTSALASSDFSVNFYSAVSEGKENENVVVSPISIQIALAMLYAGTKGVTRTQLASALKIDANDDKAIDSYKQLLVSLKDPVLQIASSAFLDSNLEVLNSYTTTVTSIFGAAINQVDFSNQVAAAKTINDWCASNTNNKIMEIFKAGDLLDAKAVLANAVYFKANWQYKFNPEHTNDQDFNAPSGKVKVKMMHITNHFQYSRNDDIKAQVLELPYSGGKFRMVVILPYEGVQLKEVAENLEKTPLPEVLKSMYRTEVIVSLPKFKLELELDLNQVLMKMGITDIFSRTDANLTGISPAPLFVSKVKQKVFIDVNEEGTEAAAVTGVEVGPRCLGCEKDPIYFNADRRFLAFFIHSSNITFMLVQWGYNARHHGEQERARSAANAPSSHFINAIFHSFFQRRRNYNGYSRSPGEQR